MECVQMSETKRKRTTDFTENAKKQRSWRERDTEMEKQRTTTLIDADDNTGDGIESSRCNHADSNMVSKANKEVVDPEADAERDQRTVYVSGIPLRASMEEVNIFFSSVCKVRNIDLILDPSLREPKAVGYIEFDDPMYVSMAVDLSGQLLLGQPIEVKPLNVGNPSAGERSYIPTGKKNFIDKPWDVMTLDERIDASTNWRELRDVENRRFFYNKFTGKRRWSIPVELGAARNRAHEAAQSNRVLAPVWTQHVPFLPLVTAHDEVEPSRSSYWDDDTVSKANIEVVDPETGLTDAERDQRSVCVSGIPLRATRKEVDMFFSSVCKVRNIELIVDPSSRVPKAMGYIEFDDPIYVPMAIDLSGQLLRGIPIEVKPLNVGDPSAGERSYIHTGKKNFLNKPRYLMTSDERIDASTNWRELTDVENRRFFYNMVTGDRRWELPQELAVVRNQYREAAQNSQFRNPVSTHHVPFLPLVTGPSNCQQVSAAGNMMTWSSQAYPWPQYQFYPFPQYQFYPFPQYSLPQNQ